MSAHKGRCFRAWRGTVARKARQGKPWPYPIRQKVPFALRPFMLGEARQMRADAVTMRGAITRYAAHQARVMAGVRQHGAARGR